MTVTDEQVATLRAQLAGDTAEHRRRLGALNWNIDGAPYVTLIDAAFFAAVERRFNKNTPESEIIEFVADARTRSDEVADSLNPQAAEQLISAVFGKSSVDNLDDRVAFTAKHILLGVLVADEHLDDAGLGAFMATARNLADRLLG